MDRRYFDRTHRDVERVVARVEGAGELAGSLGSVQLPRAVRGLLESLHETILPHMTWEEDVCFAPLDAELGPWATHLLRIQHEQLRAIIARLEDDARVLEREPTHRQLSDVRARLYGLHAVLCFHMEQEERLLLPFLGEPPEDELAV